MVAYEDLVVALTNWRINQGLPTGADAFAALETGSVDLALPVADPVELTTGEVLAIDDDGAIEVSQDGEMDMDADAPIADPGTEPESLESFAEADDAGSLEYADETAYGDMPEMDADATPAEEPIAMEAAGAEEAHGEDLAEVPHEAAPLDEPQTEEVDVLASEEEIDQELSADDMPAEEVVAVAEDEAAADEMSADDMPVEEEVDADDMDVEEVAADEGEDIDADGFEVEEIADDSFDQDEMPTQFSDDDDEGEATVMGIGVEEIVPPDES